MRSVTRAEGKHLALELAVDRVATAASMVASVWLLSVSVRALPLGTAYAVWTGIVTVGKVVLGVVLFGEPPGMFRDLAVTSQPCVCVCVPTSRNSPTLPPTAQICWASLREQAFPLQRRCVPFHGACADSSPRPSELMGRTALVAIHRKR